ncbi:UNVERIFIED_CONTAM: hypothetical protein K2H54_054360 [Gekko kuhli]
MAAIYGNRSGEIPSECETGRIHEFACRNDPVFPPCPRNRPVDCIAGNVETRLSDGCHGIETEGKTFILVAAPRRSVLRNDHWVAPVSYSCPVCLFRKGLGRLGWPTSEESQGPRPFV